MSAAATPYCSACMLRLTGLRSQERAKRTHRMPVWRRCDAPFALLSPASLFPDRSDRRTLGLVPCDGETIVRHRPRHLQQPA